MRYDDASQNASNGTFVAKNASSTIDESYSTIDSSDDYVCGELSYCFSEQHQFIGFFFLR